MISPAFYAKQLRLLANALIKYENLRIILATDEDQPAIPSVDCWNKQNAWILQMDENGFRYCEDPGIICWIWPGNWNHRAYKMLSPRKT